MNCDQCDDVELEYDVDKRVYRCPTCGKVIEDTQDYGIDEDDEEDPIEEYLDNEQSNEV